jgi:hypothetical protein
MARGCRLVLRTSPRGCSCRKKARCPDPGLWKQLQSRAQDMGHCGPVRASSSGLSRGCTSYSLLLPLATAPCPPSNPATPPPPPLAVCYLQVQMCCCASSTSYIGLDIGMRCGAFACSLSSSTRASVLTCDTLSSIRSSLT